MNSAVAASCAPGIANGTFLDGLIADADRFKQLIFCQPGHPCENAGPEAVA
ncbi:MAG: hypothetical protein ACI841_001979 [Planctomycetota bacterium]|jgi:hypothetical protein